MVLEALGWYACHELYVYDEEWNFIDYGYTDINGFYNIMGKC